MVQYSSVLVLFVFFYFLLIAVAKTCDDYFAQGISEPGFYTIDPDGEGFGADPFQVQCAFELGQKRVIVVIGTMR